MRTGLDPTPSTNASYDGYEAGDPVGGDLRDDRAARQAAASRMDRFILGGGTEEFGPCEPLLHPVLMRTQPGDASPIDMHDVQQNAFGDCFVLSPLAGLARTPEGRAFILNMISESRGADGAVASYTVTLHKPQGNALGARSFQEVKVTVPAQFECGHARPRRDGDVSEVWAAVVEAAYAKLVHGYDQIFAGGSPSVAIEVLTGRPAETFEPSQYGAARLASDLAAGKTVVLSTRPDLEPSSCQFPPEIQARMLLPGAYNLYAGHSYVAIGTEERNGKQYVLLHNPWNREGTEPDPVPVDELRGLFQEVDVGSIR